MQKQMTFLGEIVNIPEKKNNWKNDLERKKLFEDPFYREKRSKQNKPYNYDIEITEGCDLFCDHCAIRTQWNGERRFNFMTIELAEQLSKAIGFFTPKVRVVFAMHGEPTTNEIRKYCDEHRSVSKRGSDLTKKMLLLLEEYSDVLEN